MSHFLSRLKKVNKFFLLIGLVILFFSFTIPGNPDIWWHLEIGKIMWQGKSLTPSVKDIFSYSWFGYQWVNHEWLVDIILFPLYQLGGFYLLKLFFIFLILWPLKWIYELEGEKKPYLYFLLLLPVSANLFALLGLQLRTVSFFFLVLIYYCWEKKKPIYIYPFIFFFWSNMHGGFVLGLAIILFFAIEEIIKDQQGEKSYVLFIPGLSFLATFLNPYSWRIYQEIYQVIADRNGTNIVAEWQSVDFYHPHSWSMIFMLILLFFSFNFGNKKVSAAFLVSFSLLFLLSLLSWHYLYLGIIFSLILALKIIPKKWEKKVEDFFQNITSTYWKISYFLVVILLWGRVYYVGKFLSSPEKIARFDRMPPFLDSVCEKIPTGDRIFNYYDWGGYLLWQGCRNIFIDGRMANWPLKENKSFLALYLDIIRWKPNVEKLWQQYKAEWVIIPPELPINFWLQGGGKNDWVVYYQDEEVILYRQVQK